MKPYKCQTLTILILLIATQIQAQKEWTLKECIDYAIDNNISIKQQELNVESQKNALNSAKSMRLPSLSASANQNFNFGRGLTIDNIYANRNTQAGKYQIPLKREN